MDLEKFKEVVSRLKAGDLVEIVEKDPSKAGFFTDDKTGKEQIIRRPYYFSSGTNISLGEPGIMVSSSKNHVTKHVEPAYISISYKRIDKIIIR